MQRSFRRLGEEPVDVLVVGGGIHGVWAARSAARRGLSTVLAEAVDFASGTSSRSTMLAHGGLRYLAQYDFGLVKEALAERGVLTRMAGHLVRPIPFLLPFYEGAPFPKWQLRVGLWLYSWLARGSGFPRHRILSRRQVLELEPGLREEGLEGGAVYYDGQILSPERLTTIVARDAARKGARVVNHARVTGIDREGGGVVAGVEDAFTGATANVQARTVANTTGPFLDEFLEEVGIEGDRLRLTKGVHIAVPRFTEHAIVVNAEDGRTFFTVPWHEHQLVGTTDTDYTADPRQVHATREDVRYLQDSTRRYFPDAPMDEVRFTNAGLRNLLNVEGKHPSEVTREATVHEHDEEGFPMVASLVGGKLTTARVTSRGLVDRLVQDWKVQGEEGDPSLLPGGDVDVSRAEARVRRVVDDASGGVAERLVALFGSEWPRVAGAGLKALTEGSGVVRGEVVFPIETEAALTVEDVLRRRTLGWASRDQGRGAIEDVVEELVASGVPEDRAWESADSYRSTLALHDRWQRQEDS